MTVGAIILCIFFSIVVIAIIIPVCYWAHDNNYGSHFVVILLFIAVVAIAAIWVFGVWYCTSTAAGQRAMKTQRSELGDGIRREVTVYDIDGDIIEQYSGKFDIDISDSGRILFDDEEGVRHIIYPGSGIVIIDEVPE